METKIINLESVGISKDDKEYYSIEEDNTKEIKVGKENKSNNIYKPKKEKCDKILLNSNKTNSILNKNTNFNTEISAQNIILNNNKEKKLLFLVHKRKHSTDNKEEKSSNKTYTHRKHDKNDKDNIITKIQIHYRNFLISFLNEVTKKIIVEEFYKMKKLDKIINIKEYLFNNIDHHFKANTKKENMKLAESIKIKDIISPSISLCKKYKIENKNINVMKKIEEFNNPILNRILNSKYLHYFSLYYNSNRQINLREGEYNFELELSKNIKLFNDLIEKDKNDQNYISKLKKFAILNFYKNDMTSEKCD